MLNMYQGREDTQKWLKSFQCLCYLWLVLLLHQNMREALLHLSTIRKEMRKSYSSFVEGEFRFDKLSAHLDAHKCRQLISISEDAIHRIEYDESTNKLVGLVLPVQFLTNHRFISCNIIWKNWTSFYKWEQGHICICVHGTPYVIFCSTILFKYHRHQ